MIYNEIISSRDLPDEYHEIFGDLCDEIIDALFELSGKRAYADPRLFLCALSFVNARLLVLMMEDLGDKIDQKDYIMREVEVFLKNVDMLLNRKKTPGI